MTSSSTKLNFQVNLTKLQQNVAETNIYQLLDGYFK